MDHHIESMIQSGQMEMLVDFAQEHPGRVGDMLGNYRVVLAQWEKYNPDLLRKLLTLTWNRLDISTRKQFIHLMIRMVYRLSKSEISSKGIETGDIKVSPFNFQSDEIDLDRTLECMAEGQHLSYDNIFILDRKKRRKAAVIVMDASGSMQGINLSMAAIAVASLAMNLDYKDEYGVILFSEKVNIFKRIDQPKNIDKIISGVLDILPEGRTNIGLALSEGLREIRRTHIDHKVGILLTDGWQNMGLDPVTIASKFPRLHVINLPGGNPEFSMRIAKAGKGYFIPLRNMFDISKAIIKCLR
jgi:Mg-chelatase subunit ChlD